MFSQSGGRGGRLRELMFVTQIIIITVPKIATVETSGVTNSVMSLFLHVVKN